MKKAALLLAATLGLAACSQEEPFDVLITVDPIIGKGGAVVAYEPLVIAPVE